MSLGLHPIDSLICLESKNKNKLDKYGYLSPAGNSPKHQIPPIFQSPLLDLFSEANVCTAAFDQVLEGTNKCPPGTDPYGLSTYSSTLMSNYNPTYSNPSTGQDYCRLEKGMGIHILIFSAIHFGHYMAGTFNPHYYLQYLSGKFGLYHWVLIKMAAHWPQHDVGKTGWKLKCGEIADHILFKGDFNNNNKWLG